MPPQRKSFSKVPLFFESHSSKYVSIQSFNLQFPFQVDPDSFSHRRQVKFSKFDSKKVGKRQVKIRQKPNLTILLQLGVDEKTSMIKSD